VVATFELTVTLPNGAFIFIRGVPDLAAVVTAVITADGIVDPAEVKPVQAPSAELKKDGKFKHRKISTVFLERNGAKV